MTREKHDGFGVLVDPGARSDPDYSLYPTGWKGWYADKRTAQLCAARWREEVPKHWRVYVVQCVSALQDHCGTLIPLDARTGEPLPLNPDWVECAPSLDEDGVRHRQWRHKETDQYTTDRPVLRK